MSTLPTWRLDWNSVPGQALPMDGRWPKSSQPRRTDRSWARSSLPASHFSWLRSFATVANHILTLKQLTLDVPPGWKSELFMDKVPGELAPGQGCSVMFRVTPPADAQITKAYFHRNDPETDSIYTIDEPQYVTLPLPPPPVSVRVVYLLAEREGVMTAVARTPLHDQHGAAWSMPLSVVPPFSIHTIPSTQIIAARAGPRDRPECSGPLHGGSCQRRGPHRSTFRLEGATGLRSRRLQQTGRAQHQFQGPARWRERRPLSRLCPGAGEWA